jgi:hypothetical protein
MLSTKMPPSVLAYALATILLTLNYVAAMLLGLVMARFLLKALLGHKFNHVEPPHHLAKHPGREV